VVCQLESSGKWPDEVEAIQQMKAAFYVKMSELLSKDRSLLCSPTFHYLDVLKVWFAYVYICQFCCSPARRKDLCSEYKLFTPGR